MTSAICQRTSALTAKRWAGKPPKEGSGHLVLMLTRQLHISAKWVKPSQFYPEILENSVPLKFWRSSRTQEDRAETEERSCGETLWQILDSLHWEQKGWIAGNVSSVFCGPGIRWPLQCSGCHLRDTKADTFVQPKVEIEDQGHSLLSAVVTLPRLRKREMNGLLMMGRGHLVSKGPSSFSVISHTAS